jgi:hypothetical protein
MTATVLVARTVRFRGRPLRVHTHSGDGRWSLMGGTHPKHEFRRLGKRWLWTYGNHHGDARTLTEAVKTALERSP